ncbi:uncharacterized protein [Tursiops truncatus]|uniref:uncharacterized protein n=1 Tax=Tursiops truncatus TaxID=9739 RepID=UPI003CCF1FF9
MPLRMGWQERRQGSWSVCPGCSRAFDKGWGKRLSVYPPIHRPVEPGLALPISNRKPNTTVSSSSVWKIRFCFREHIPFPIVPSGPRAAAVPAAAVPSSPRPERAPQQRPRQEVAGRSMRRRRETQKLGRRVSGARSASARRGACSHRRRRGSHRRQTLARLTLLECLGPGGGPPHTSERAVLAPVRRCRLPCSLLPTFWPGCPRRRSESRPCRSPPPRGSSHCATLLPPKGGGARPTKGAGLQAAPQRAARGGNFTLYLCLLAIT